MAGRGFLKSRLAQMTLKESEAPSKPEEPLKLVAQPISYTDVPKVPAIVISAQINGHQQVVRGRRAILTRIAQGTGSQRLCEDITVSKTEPGNLKDIACPTITPISKNSEISKLHSHTIQPQQHILDIPAPREVKEEKSPVICRVLGESNRGFYHMTQLSSNYIRVELEKNKGIYEYRVDFLPQVDAKFARFYLLNQHKHKFPVKIFDGTLLYLPSVLPERITTLVGNLNDESEVTMTITFKSKNSLRECIHFYNVFLRSMMKSLGLIEFGRSFFDQNKRILISQFKLEVWPGYKTSIDSFENGLYMCCDVSHRVLSTQTMIETMTDIMIKSKQCNKDGKEELMSALCGSTVITHYNRKTYRIDDIDFSINPLSTFHRGGIEISYLDYYRQTYQIEIKNLYQPLIITKAKKKDINNKNATKDSDISCLVPELCNLTGLTEKMKKNKILMSTLQNHTLVTAEGRQNDIIELVNLINAHEVASKKCKDWGLVMRPVLVEMEGPVYKKEIIRLGNNINGASKDNNMDWGRAVVNNAMFVPINVLNWVIMYNPRDEPLARTFSRQLAECSCPLGMEIKPPIPIQIQGLSPEVFVSNIHTTVSRNPRLQLIVIVVPNDREDRYNAVKRICCSEIGIPSQVIISKTLSKPERLKSITQKIALQINCKLGGACWAIDIPMIKTTMIVGIDVYHEKNKQTSSVVGFVASMNKQFTEWYSVAAMQRSTNQELMQSVQNAFYKILHQFKEKNGLLPEKIIIYRDGVSDGDLKHVEEIELSSLIESFKCYQGNYNPKVTLIIVQKRINTRVFQFKDEKYVNPSPGTVIDNTITRRNYFDFFLVSQNPRQGTVNPTHYIVLKNGCDLNVEHVQRLTYKLCHLYYNWCGTVKVPAPVLYAHKLAYLIGHNVRQMPSDNLCKSLFFL